MAGGREAIAMQDQFTELTEDEWNTAFRRCLQAIDRVLIVHAILFAVPVSMWVLELLAFGTAHTFAFSIYYFPISLALWISTMIFASKAYRGISVWGGEDIDKFNLVSIYYYVLTVPGFIITPLLFWVYLRRRHFIAYDQFVYELKHGEQRDSSLSEDITGAAKHEALFEIGQSFDGELGVGTSEEIESGGRAKVDNSPGIDEVALRLHKVELLYESGCISEEERNGRRAAILAEL